MHASVFVANLGSIGLKMFHITIYMIEEQLLFLFAWGDSQKKSTKKIWREFIERYFVEISTTIDERISDGFYYIRAMNEFKKILNNPKALEKIGTHPIDDSL